MPNINNPFLNEVAYILMEALGARNAYEISAHHVRMSDGDGCYYDMTLAAEAVYDLIDDHLHKTCYAEKIARLDDAEESFKDARRQIYEAYKLGYYAGRDGEKPLANVDIFAALDEMNQNGMKGAIA